jgi:hypothetical protein
MSLSLVFFCGVALHRNQSAMIFRDDVALNLVRTFEICKTFASRKYRLIRYSLAMPAAPKSCKASVATFVAVSLEWHFAMAARRVLEFACDHRSDGSACGITPQVRGADWPERRAVRTKTVRIQASSCYSRQRILTSVRYSLSVATSVPVKIAAGPVCERRAITGQRCVCRDPKGTMLDGGHTWQLKARATTD